MVKWDSRAYTTVHYWIRKSRRNGTGGRKKSESDQEAKNGHYGPSGRPRREKEGERSAEELTPFDFRSAQLETSEESRQNSAKEQTRGLKKKVVWDVQLASEGDRWCLGYNHQEKEARSKTNIRTERNVSFGKKVGGHIL